MTQLDYSLESYGGQAGAFTFCRDAWNQVRWIAEVCPSIVNANDRHLALQPANCIRLLSAQDFAALDPQPYRI
jgi:hypothetical protein